MKLTKESISFCWKCRQNGESYQVIARMLREKVGVDVHNSTIMRAIERYEQRLELLRHFNCPDNETEISKLLQTNFQNPTDIYKKKKLKKIL